MLTSLLPSQFTRLSHQMDRLFDEVWHAQNASTVWPGLNVWRDGHNLFAEAEIPGFSINEVEVLASEDSLTIRGQRQPSTPDNATPIRIERTVTQFERTLQLPVKIDADNVQASLQRGILTLTMPIAESARPRQISVKTSNTLPVGKNSK